jgi:hypothetical protein
VFLCFGRYNRTGQLTFPVPKTGVRKTLCFAGTGVDTIGQLVYVILTPFVNQTLASSNWSRVRV